jgi:hypothetical protein
MSVTVCLFAHTLDYPDGGGHLWVYLNWALGLRALGCRVVWLEGVDAKRSADRVRMQAAALKERLRPYGLADDVAVCAWSGEPLVADATEGCLDLEAATEVDVLLNFRYDVRPEVVSRFRRSALIDIDPGLLQVWMSRGEISVARYDVYFSTGETVGRPGAAFPDAGVMWQYAPPCVALDAWTTCRADERAPYTTVSQWYAEEWMRGEDGEPYRNDKRSGFLPFLDLPRYTTQPLELALCLALAPDDEDERVMLRRRGWQVREAGTVSSTPWDYQRYIQSSRGEFSCAKPSCVRLQNAWVSDRTLCYLASGKPAVVQHTGPSRLLPDASGLFRFRSLEEAVRCLEMVTADYERQCGFARALAEEYFDARKVAGSVLERALA